MYSQISTKELYFIEEPEQVECLTSKLRQEIVDSLGASQPASIRDLASELGVAADSLYYHIRKLIQAGLVKESGQRDTSRRAETLYRLVGSQLRLRYDTSDPRRMEGICRLVSAMMRVAAKDFEAGCGHPAAVTEGRRRNLWAGRSKGWLSSAQLAEANRLIGSIRELFEERGDGPGQQLCTFAWTLSPVQAQPLRRS